MEKENKNNIIPIGVTIAMAECDKKASLYGKRAPIKNNNKEELKWSTFSNNDELNSCNKRTSTQTKLGNQENIVDFINFYPTKKSSYTYKDILLALREQMLINQKLLNQLKGLITIEKNAGTYYFYEILQSKNDMFYNPYNIYLQINATEDKQSKLKKIIN